MKCVVCQDRPSKRSVAYANHYGLCDVCAHSLELAQRRLGRDPSWAATEEIEWAAKRARAAERRRAKEQSP